MAGIEKRIMERRLTRDLVDIIVLKFLSEEPMHGYMINLKFRKVFNCLLSPSTLYPLLYNLEEQGCIIGTWDNETKRERKVYSITDKGEEQLLVARVILDNIHKVLRPSLT